MGISPAVEAAVVAAAAVAVAAAVEAALAALAAAAEEVAAVAMGPQWMRTATWWMPMETLFCTRENPRLVKREVHRNSRFLAKVWDGSWRPRVVRLLFWRSEPFGIDERYGFSGRDCEE